MVYLDAAVTIDGEELELEVRGRAVREYDGVDFDGDVQAYWRGKWEPLWSLVSDAEHERVLDALADEATLSGWGV